MRDQLGDPKEIVRHGYDRISDAHRRSSLAATGL